MPKKMRHSKFKNTGILFELLTRQITADIIAGKENSEARDLLFKYFKENTELGREWRLYNFLLSEKIKNDIERTKRALYRILMLVSVLFGSMAIFLLIFCILNASASFNFKSSK